ncbi:MAG: hypothetical protein FWE02_04135 [Defluviitaleaceae bacterium]|nr:hypothetical protein [Defluviitaleaceae bacterium]
MFKKNNELEIEEIREAAQNIGYYLSEELLEELSEEAKKDWGATNEKSIANVSALLYDIHSKNLRITYVKASSSLEFLRKEKNSEAKTRNTTHRGHILFCSTTIDKSVAMFSARIVRTNFDEKTRTYAWEIDVDSIIPLKPFIVPIGKDLRKAPDEILEQIELAFRTADGYNISKLGRVYNEYFDFDFDLEM